VQKYINVVFSKPTYPQFAFFASSFLKNFLLNLKMDKSDSELVGDLCNPERETTILATFFM
jgi:hypothetical protein